MEEQEVESKQGRTLSFIAQSHSQAYITFGFFNCDEPIQGHYDKITVVVQGLKAEGEAAPGSEEAPGPEESQGANDRQLFFIASRYVAKYGTYTFYECRESILGEFDRIDFFSPK